MLEKLYDAYVSMNEIEDTKKMYYFMAQLEEKLGERINLEISSILLDYTAEVERKSFAEGFRRGVLLMVECSK